MRKIISPLNILKIAGVAVFAVLLSRMDRGALWEQVSRAGTGGIWLAVGLVAAQTVLKFARWHILLGMAGGGGIPPGRSFAIYYNGFLWGAITPGKLGELIKVYFLSSEKVPVTAGILAIILERIFDVLCALLFILVFSLFYISGMGFVFFAVFVTSLAVVVFLVFLFREAAVKFVFNTIAISSIRRGIETTPESLREGLRLFLSMKIWIFGLLTLLYWGFTGFLFYSVLGMCGVRMELAFILLSHSVVLVGMQLPITVFGVGVREFILQWMLGRVGRPLEEAMLFSFLIIALMLIQAGLGALCSFFLPGGGKKKEPPKSAEPEEAPGEIEDIWGRDAALRRRAAGVFKKDKVCVVIPTKNEEATLERIIQGVAPYAGEIMVIDGHSTDGTRGIAEKYGCRFLLDEGKGKGCALRQAIREVDRDIIVFIDADGSHNPVDIPLLCMPIFEGTADHVTGSRKLAGSDELSGTDLDTFLRLVGSEFVTLTINFRFGVKLTDSQNGFRALSSAMGKKLDLKEDLTTIEQEMIIKTLAAGYRMAEVPTHEFSRWVGESRISLKKVWGRYVFTAIKYCLFA